MFAVFLHCTAVPCVVVMSHPQPSLSAPVYCGCQLGPTDVLIHPGRAVDQQCASSCVVWIVVAVHSEVVIFKHTQSAEARVSWWVQSTHGTSRPINLPHFHVLMHVAALVMLVSSQVSSQLEPHLETL